MYSYSCVLCILHKIIIKKKEKKKRVWPVPSSRQLVKTIPAQAVQVVVEGPLLRYIVVSTAA